MTGPTRSALPGALRLGTPQKNVRGSGTRFHTGSGRRRAFGRRRPASALWTLRSGLVPGCYVRPSAGKTERVPQETNRTPGARAASGRPLSTTRAIPFDSGARAVSEDHSGLSTPIRPEGRRVSASSPVPTGQTAVLLPQTLRSTWS